MIGVCRICGEYEKDCECVKDDNSKDGGPAFPVIVDFQGNSQAGYATGLSIRDYFAGQALCGMASIPGSCIDGHLGGLAYKMA
ncbi:MAG: hypothetical protein KAS32_15240, partial [Candidatus Peribacteraceae bacterium]|nr:hypothetical protein [Candidatus Peribacteraceae bacterium]